MKKIIFISLALVLVLSAAAATVVLARDEAPDPPNSQIQRMENALFPKLRSAVAEGIVSRDLAIRIVDAWKQKPQSELPQLYQRVINLLNSRQETQIQDASFTRLLRQAVSRKLITAEKAREISEMWQEQARLYQRLANLVNGGRR